MSEGRAYASIVLHMQVHFLPDAFPGAKAHGGFLEVCQLSQSLSLQNHAVSQEAGVSHKALKSRIQPEQVAELQHLMHRQESMQWMCQ